MQCKDTAIILCKKNVAGPQTKPTFATHLILPLEYRFQTFSSFPCGPNSLILSILITVSVLYVSLSLCMLSCPFTAFIALICFPHCP